MKKEYKKPVVQFIKLKKEDVLTGSQNMSDEPNPTSSNELLNDIVTNDINPVE